MTEHTETPWETMGSRGDIKSVCKGFPERMVAKATGQPTSEERAANAAFIVKAVNAHDALVEYIRSSASAGCATAEHLLKMYGLVDVGTATGGPND